MHHIPYSKPDLEYHLNTNSTEIEFYLSENDFDFFKTLQNKLKTLNFTPEIKILKAHKIIHPYSKLLGPPYPERIFVRHKINLHIKNCPNNNRISNRSGPKARSTPTRSSY